MFTGGKWEVTKWSNHRHLHISSDEKEECYGSLIFIADCGNYNEEDGLPYNREVYDNARLISAAPDLYYALKTALFMLQSHVFSQHPDDSVSNEVKEIIEKAIAKAEESNGQ